MLSVMDFDEGVFRDIYFSMGWLLFRGDVKVSCYREGYGFWVRSI